MRDIEQDQKLRKGKGLPTVGYRVPNIPSREGKGGRDKIKPDPETRCDDDDR